MTTVQEVQDLAATLQAHRDDWPDIIPIVNYLLPWRHVPYDELFDMATAWVSNPGNRTPASLKYMTQVPPRSAGISSTRRKGKEDQCYICGRGRRDCAEMRIWEEAHGIADPHDFETSDEAFANRSVKQLGDLMADIDELRATRAKERADRARAQIRPMISTNGDRTAFSRIDDQPRKCLGCGGTLSRDEHETHPACEVPA